MSKAKFLRCGNTIAFLGEPANNGNDWIEQRPWRETCDSVNMAKRASLDLQRDAAGKYKHTGQLRVVNKLPANAGV